MNYPVFAPPPELAVVRRRDWNRKQAAMYRDWLIDAIDLRIANLLEFIEVGPPARPTDLGTIGQKVEQFLRMPAFSTTGPSGPTLTNEGHALAADVGLLVAKLLRDIHPTLHWDIVRAPKTDMSYNLPVLAGFVNEQVLDPVEGGIGEARAVLKGKATSDAWLKTYEFWSQRAP
jgi:hypothetical protein